MDVIATLVLSVTILLLIIVVAITTYTKPLFVLGWVIIGSGLFLIGWSAGRCGIMSEHRRQAKRDKENKV